METSILPLHLSRFDNETHAQLHESIRALIAQVTPAVAGLEKLYPLYQSALGDELASLDIVRKSRFSARIAEQDSVRDNIFRGFADTVKGSRKHFDSSVRAAADSLWEIFLHYGNVAERGNAAETAAINDMLREMKTPELAEALTTLKLTEWSEKLAAENAGFEQLMSDRYDEAAAKTPLRMANTRLATDRYYRAVTAHLDNMLLIGGNPAAFDSFAAAFNAIIKNFKDKLAQGTGRKNAAAKE